MFVFCPRCYKFNKKMMKQMRRDQEKKSSLAMFQAQSMKERSLVRERKGK